jgi:membrane associated rhomboid family serine protease
MFPLYDLNPHRRFPWLTVAIIAANVAVQIWMSSLGPLDQQRVAMRFGVVPKRVSAVGKGQEVTVPLRDIRVDVRNGEQRVVEVAKVQLPTDPSSVYPTLLTTMFLHGGWLHLLSNMWILWIFGNNIEDRLGHFIYVAYYVLGGIVASFCHYFTDMQSDMPVVGASGAVAAVLGGYAITYPWAKVRTVVFIGLIMVLDIPALIWLGIWFVTQNVIPAFLAFNEVVRDPVAYWAHIGGFLAGIVLMPLFALGASPPEADWRREAEDMFRFDEPRERNW